MFLIWSPLSVLSASVETVVEYHKAFYNLRNNSKIAYSSMGKHSGNKPVPIFVSGCENLLKNNLSALNLPGTTQEVVA